MSKQLPTWLQGAELIDEELAPAPPSLEAFSPLVLRQLSRNTPHSDIIMGLVQRCNCSWEEAERFVSGIAIQNHQTIRSAQRPLLLIMTIGTFLGALLMLGVGIFNVLGGSLSRLTLFALTTGLLMLSGSLYGAWQLIHEMSEG